MPAKPEAPEHSLIKAEILTACEDLGYEAIEEYHGKSWRADVLATRGSEKVAFEVQLSPQSLKRTLERQEKYAKDEVRGCWFFQRPVVSKLLNERPDLPLFYVSRGPDNALSISLSGRKNLPIHDFIQEFLTGKIKFCEVARTQPEQLVKIVFHQMECWQCKAVNHLYYVDTTFRSACNATIELSETMWGSDRQEYRPEIIDAARQFLSTEEGSHLRLGEIKTRYSRTIEDSYVSFGCYACDSIFGEWYVREAEQEAMYGCGQVAVIERTLVLHSEVSLALPHWCHPGGRAFCDELSN